MTDIRLDSLRTAKGFATSCTVGSEASLASLQFSSASTTKALIFVKCRYSIVRVVNVLRLTQYSQSLPIMFSPVNVLWTSLLSKSDWFIRRAPGVLHEIVRRRCSLAPSTPTADQSDNEVQMLVAILNDALSENDDACMRLKAQYDAFSYLWLTDM